MRFLELKLGEKSLSLKGQKMNETLERDMMKVKAIPIIYEQVLTHF